jgi:transcriptional regulator with XRE-family HTH domain
VSLSPPAATVHTCSLESATIEQLIGARVTQLRKQRGRTQIWLAKAMAVTLETTWSRWTVARLEAGTRATSVRELLALALCLGAEPADLLGAVTFNLPRTTLRAAR